MPVSPVGAASQLAYGNANEAPASPFRGNWGLEIENEYTEGNMKRAFIAIVLGVALLAAGTTRASAGTYEQWRFRDGTICYQDHGSSRWDGTTVTAKWRAGGVNIISRDSCAGFSRGMVIDLKTYNDPRDYACAKTGSNSYSWEYVYSSGTRTAKWVPNLMVIWINTAPALQPKCTATSGMRAHLLTHETGHALGLAHLPAGSKSVMPQGAWSVWWPTSLDLAHLNSIY